MADKFNLKALISATDKLSPILKNQMKLLNTWKRQFQNAGKGGLGMGLGLGAALAVPTKAFVDAENAATQLQNTLMDNNGVSAGFEQLSKIAVQLGNQLPGTTADFMGMASQLKSLGVSTDELSGGALKATAYLAVVGKPLGVTYESAAEAVGKLANSFGIAANDLVPFADTLQRTLHMGIDLQQMQYAMARISGPLKALGKQGFGVANDLVPLVGMLIQVGVQGEEAGTGVKKMIEVAALHGKFTNVANLVKDLEKMNKLRDVQKLEKFKKLFGEEHAGKALIIAAGGYDKMIEKMKQQASLQQRVNNSLGTLGNLWEAATGTFTNAMVAFGEAWAPELKALADKLNIFSGNLLDWAKNNGSLIKGAAMSAVAFVGLRVACLGVAAGIGLITAAARLNPLMLLAQGVALAAPLIVEHWDEITKFLGDALDGAINRITGAWTRFVEFIQPGLDVIKMIIEGWKQIINLMPSMPDFSMPSGPQNNGMRPPGYNRNKILQGGNRVSGGIDVNFNNAPAGLRVVPAVAGPLAVNPNVGYRSLGRGNE